MDSGLVLRTPRNDKSNIRKQEQDEQMAEVKIKTEVAGRVCSIVAAIGVSVGDGEDVVVVEAMKMEIPVTATAAGKVKSILVNVDDMLTEGQVVVVIET